MSKVYCRLCGISSDNFLCPHLCDILITELAKKNTANAKTLKIKLKEIIKNEIQN